MKKFAVYPCGQSLCTKRRQKWQILDHLPTLKCPRGFWMAPNQHFTCRQFSGGLKFGNVRTEVIHVKWDLIPLPMWGYSENNVHEIGLWCFISKQFDQNILMKKYLFLYQWNKYSLCQLWLWIFSIRYNKDRHPSYLFEKL